MNLYLRERKDQRELAAAEDEVKYKDDDCQDRSVERIIFLIGFIIINNINQQDIICELCCSNLRDVASYNCYEIITSG